ncbi:hypothetical protein ACFL02_06925 [Planctomycetota bacterium]
MKKYTIILELILILLCTNGCGKEETSKDKSSIPKEPNTTLILKVEIPKDKLSIPKEPNTTLTLKFGSLKDGYNLNPFAIEIELSNNSPENYIMPWFDDQEQGNAVLFLRPFETNDKWLAGYRLFTSSHRIFPRVYEMVIPAGGKLNFWINLWGEFRPPSELTPGKYEVYAALVEYPDVITTTHTINIYDEHREWHYDISPPLHLIIDPSEKPVPIKLNFQSLPETLPHVFDDEIIFVLENDQYALRGIDPWHLNNKFNVQLFYRTAGTNDKWEPMKERFIYAKFRLSPGYVMSKPFIRFTQLLPPKSKLTFRVPVRKGFSPGKYEVYASLTALPKVKTGIKIFRAVRK